MIKLGFVSAILPDLTLEQVVEIGASTKRVRRTLSFSLRPPEEFYYLYHIRPESGARLVHDSFVHGRCSLSGLSPTPGPLPSLE